MKKILVLTITLLLTAGTVFAQNIPQLINYQGKLTDSDGNALATKEYEMSFSIFTTQSGGTAVWGPQEFKEPNKITVARGFFNVILGPVDSTGRKIELGFESPNAYLEITVDGKVITPRQSVLSTSYAFQAQKADEAKIAVNGVSPVGSIITWPTKDVPEGHLECNGQELSTTEYPELFAVLKYTYGGEGDKFNLPDYRGQFLRGTANGSENDPDRDSRKARGDGLTGDNVGTTQGWQNESHNHPGSTINEGAGSSGSAYLRRINTTYRTQLGLNIASDGGNQANPININVMYCIKYKKYNE
ncbi:MAG: tail fiber protein [Deltaproteobacteria bacterium]|nr:tail fiber protein [Deltaproteobacteria bacterium]